MASRGGSDLWSEIMETEDDHPARIDVIYTRKTAKKINQEVQQLPPRPQTENRVSVAGNKRISWRNRSLSISGKYRKFAKKSIPGEEVKQRPDHTSTKKCSCLFELKALCDHEGWTLTVVNGMHNHLPARNLKGHSYAGRLSSEDATILVEMSKSLSRPRDTLNSLKNRDPTNVSTIKSIYNVRQKYRVIEWAGKTQMQQLMTRLTEHKYIDWHRNDEETGCVIDMFWAHPFGVKILRAFSRVGAYPFEDQDDPKNFRKTIQRIMFTYLRVAGSYFCSYSLLIIPSRGRTSIAVPKGANYGVQLKRKEAKKKPKQAFYNPPLDFIEERVAYFQEVDSFELLEESPSPKTFAKRPVNHLYIRDLQSIIDQTYKKWMYSRPLIDSSGSLTVVLNTPAVPMGSLSSVASESSNDKAHKTFSPVEIPSLFSSDQKDICAISTDIDGASWNSVAQRSSIIDFDALNLTDMGSKDIELAVGKLSLASSSSSDVDAFINLLGLCGQSIPCTLSEAFSKYCDLSSIVKIGEGTYGEAFKAGGAVFKIVPVDGDLKVNGEVQKRSGELFEELLLSLTLNSLREYGPHADSQNKCSNFIQTKNLCVCQGAYDASLIRAWEDWDEKHVSENDHPMAFPEKQCYVVFVLADGGRDLESFVLSNFDEVRSLLVQVTAALAVAEAAYEFEHRDLHWGNILLSRNDTKTTEFILQGRQLLAETFGLSISIIDFTLSRINTGESILFLDLSADPGLFDGPKGDKQAETYRKMLEVTDGCWEESFPKTNVLWLHYLVDILLSKKSFQRTTGAERDLRSLRKRLLSYDSAQNALSDEFFNDLWADGAV